MILIGGPTASGKTALAIAVAKHYGTEIISADSRQCYRELHIGVARPSEEELAAVPHHFIASHSIHDKVTAASFEQYALEKAAALFHKYDHIVMVGGTGLYLKAFTEGLDAIPEVPQEIQEAIAVGYATGGLPWLQGQLQKDDPEFFAKGEIKNPHRMIRALEVLRATGKSILTYRKGERAVRPFSLVKMALNPPRPLLYQRINDRVTAMMQTGLLDEVKSLLPYRHLPALQTVGYQELFDHLQGIGSLAAAVEHIQRNTRNYAKRQVTWFRKQEGFLFADPTAMTKDELINKIAAAASLTTRKIT